MELKKLSASSVQSADGCLARWQAQQVGYGGEIKNEAALTGTTVHATFERYVQDCILTKKYSPDLDTLRIFYRAAFRETFETADTSRPEYEDGWALVEAWWLRSVSPDVTEGWDEFDVLSTEIKSTFMVPTSVGDVPFNYIFDRFDKMKKLGPHVYRVVDYKSNRAPESSETLHDKIQARCYALAAQIQHPDAEKIYVSFDMLRHSGLVETSFTRQDNIDTFYYLIDTAERIIATPDTYTDPATGEVKPRIAPETLNPMCGFCVRKASCKELQKNQLMGGVVGNESLDELVEIRALAKIAADANKKLTDELDKLIKAQVEEYDVDGVSTGLVDMKMKVTNYRTVDSERVFNIIGEELFAFYGGFNMNIGKIDEMLKGDHLTPDQKEELKAAIRRSPSAPRVDTKLKTGIRK